MITINNELQFLCSQRDPGYVVVAQRLIDYREWTAIQAVTELDKTGLTDVVELAAAFGVNQPTEDELEETKEILGGTTMADATTSTEVKQGDEVVYVDYPSQVHYPAIVKQVTDASGVAVDLNVIYGPGREESRNGVQHSADETVSHTWHFKAEAPAEEAAPTSDTSSAADTNPDATEGVKTPEEVTNNEVANTATSTTAVPSTSSTNMIEDPGYRF